MWKQESQEKRLLRRMETRAVQQKGLSEVRMGRDCTIFSGYALGKASRV